MLHEVFGCQKVTNEVPTGYLRRPLAAPGRADGGRPEGSHGGPVHLHYKPLCAFAFQYIRTVKGRTWSGAVHPLVGGPRETGGSAHQREVLPVRSGPQPFPQRPSDIAQVCGVGPGGRRACVAGEAMTDELRTRACRTRAPPIAALPEGARKVFLKPIEVNARDRGPTT